MPFTSDETPQWASPNAVCQLLADLIHDKTGMYFDSGRLEIMKDKLDPLVVQRGCASLLDYYYILKYSDEQDEEWHKVVDALSIQETYFWREFDQVSALTDVVVPQWFAHRITPFRIWSAACATGEEPFSIAMALHEAGHGGKPIQIMASDASRAALEKATRGIYRERSFRSLPERLREKYFTETTGGWQVAPQIKRMVEFRQANLRVQHDVSELAQAEAIFCRNVFIYFSPEAIRKTVKWMAEQMAPERHLFVGAAESLLKLTTDFSLEQVGTALVYMRNKPGANPAS